MNIKFEKLGQFLDWAEQTFIDNELHFGHGTDNPWDEAVAIALHVLQLPPDIDNSAMELLINHEQSDSMVKIANDRIESKKPLAYLINTAWFGGEKYYVDERVIIPRSPFAELILNKFNLWLNTESPNILELCTGSGCIAIMTAKHLGSSKVTAIDISKDALEVAKKNVELHGVQSQVTLIESDLFNNILEPALEHKFDLIISNPPYIGLEEKHDLPTEYLCEPDLALYAPEEGLAITKKILNQAQKYLNKSGYLIIEVGYNWDLLEQAYPKFKFNWVELENGGCGLFALSYDDLNHLEELYGW